MAGLSGKERLAPGMQQVRPRGGVNYYGVRWRDGSSDYVAEDQLELTAAAGRDDPYALIADGRLGRSEDLRRSLPQLKVLSSAEVPDTRSIKVTALIGGQA